MRNLSKQLGHKDSSEEPRIGAVGEHNSGQMSADASEDEGSTHPDINKDDIRDRKVDPEAVRESFKEAELDPIAESEPEEGEKAA
jgi:hypothetical protein